MSVPLPRIAGRALSAPTADDVRASLRDAAGYRFDDLWRQVCGTARLSTTCHHLDEGELAALLTAVGGLPGRAGLAGRDVGARAHAYSALVRAGAVVAVTPTDALPPSVSGLSSPGATTEMLVQGASSGERLGEIVALDVFSPTAVMAMDAVVREAAQTVGASIGLITIVLDQAQVFAGSHGLHGWLEEAGGTPIEWSFCATAVRTRAPYLVPDAARDVLQRTNPLVVHDGVGSYLGVPLITTSGQVLGACCVIDGQARAYSAADVSVVEAAAADVVQLLERRRPAPAVPLDSTGPRPEH